MALRFDVNGRLPLAIHDATPWCALAVNYCLVASGLPGDDSLWALDFARYGTRLKGAAVGAIATKARDGGGHVFLVVGRTNATGASSDAAATRATWSATRPSTHR
jgi:uncharacterized protein (TIGR02594 family)